MQKLKRKQTKPLGEWNYKEILNKGKEEEIRALLSFDSNDNEELIRKKFNIWSRWFFPKYFLNKQGKMIEDAPFHKEMDLNNIRVYKGTQTHFINAGFRGCAKTSKTKLFLAYTTLNDIDHRRKFMKVLASDGANSKQIVTDIYNIMVDERIRHYYSDVLQTMDDKKREETMSSFTTATGVKISSGTVGMEQRGDLQEESRPDLIWFEDFENRKTLRSAVMTKSIWDNMEEARTGLSRDGGEIYTCNYLSERGNVHKLIQREHKMIIPIKENGKPTWPGAYTMADINNIEKNADDFAGEYMCQPSTGEDIYFDRASIDKQEIKVPIREVAGFKIYHKYKPSHRYGSGHDVAGGVGLDSSTSVFYDFTTIPCKVVATYNNNTIKPDEFGYEIKNQADRFGKPIVAPEVNNHGHSTIAILNREYDNIYFREEKQLKAGVPSKRRNYGWETNTATKPKMLSELKRAVEDGHVELSDPNLIAELKSYTRDDMMDKEVDPRLTTRHFDLLIAAAIGWQMRNYSEHQIEEEYKQPDYEPSSEYEVVQKKEEPQELKEIFEGNKYELM